MNYNVAALVLGTAFSTVATAAPTHLVLPPGVKLAKRNTAESPAALGYGKSRNWRQLIGTPKLKGYKETTSEYTPDQLVSFWKLNGRSTIAQVDDGGPGPYFVGMPHK
jgi:hypothetical protein